MIVSFIPIFHKTIFLKSKPVLFSCLVAQLCRTLLRPHGLSLQGSFVHGDSPGKNTGVGCHALLQGIFPTQRTNPGLPPCMWILYHLSHQESPGILEWVAYPFSSGSSPPRNRTWVSCIMGEFFTIWATREVLVGPPLCLIPIESCKWTEQSIQNLITPYLCL